jgi:uncharacterized membrane protein
MDFSWLLDNLPLIKPDDTWVLWAVILAGVALSIWLEQNFTWAAKLSGPVLALCVAMVLSNLRVMPTTAPVYDTVQDDLVPLALPLLLFRANAFHIVRTTGWLFLAFHVAAVGTIVGALVGSLVIYQHVEHTDQVAGIMTGSYIGGGINFVAVSNTYKTSKELTNPLLVADNFVMAGTFLMLLLISSSKWALRLFRHPHTVEAVDSKKLAAEHWRRKEISLLDIAAALAIAMVVVALARLTSSLVGDWLGTSPTAELVGNKYIHITAWSMLAATLGHRVLTKIHGAEEMGGYLLYVFLFVIGLPADLLTVFKNVPLLFVFCLIIAMVNLVFTLVVGWLLRLNLEDLLISVNATLGGPPSAAAMAISKGWSEMVLPAILVGIWGYAIGTACGLMVGKLVRQWLM